MTSQENLAKHPEMKGIFLPRSPGVLARNTVLATAWQGLRLTLQFTYLILVARMLGANNYGLFAGCVALAASLSPLAGLGFTMIMVKEVARNSESFPIYWARLLRGLAVSIPLLVGMMLLLAMLFLQIDGYWEILGLICAAELIAMPYITAASVAFQAHQRLGRSVFNHVQLNAVRLIVIASLSLTGHETLIEFAWGYFGATACAAILSLIQVGLAFGAPLWRQSRISGELREGLGFSLNILANSAHGEIDKTLLLRLGTASAAGNYSLAGRIITAANMPLSAYIISAVPRLFRAGEFGITSVALLARRLLTPILIYGTIVAFVIVILSPLLPWVFGEDFTESRLLLLWLAPIPLLSGISQLGVNVLIAAGHLRTRLAIETISLGANVALNVIFISRLGGTGTALALLTSQLLLAVLPFLAIYRLARESKPVVQNEKYVN